MPEKVLLKPLVGDGKITIPKRFRDDLDLDIGDEVYMTVKPAKEVVTANLNTEDSGKEVIGTEDGEYELQAFGAGTQDKKMADDDDHALNAYSSGIENKELTGSSDDDSLDAYSY